MSCMSSNKCLQINNNTNYKDILVSNRLYYVSGIINIYLTQVLRYIETHEVKERWPCANYFKL